MKKTFFLLFGMLMFVVWSCERLTTPTGPSLSSLSSAISDFVYVSDFAFHDFDLVKLGSEVVADDTPAPNFGNSTIAVSYQTNTGDIYKHVEYTLGANYVNRFVFFALIASKNLSPYNALQFKVRGSGNALRVILRADGFQNENATSPNSYDDYGYTISTTPGEWTTFVIPFTALQQEGWGADFQLADILSNFDRIQFKAASMTTGESGWYDLDDVRFVTVVQKR